MTPTRSSAAVTGKAQKLARKRARRALKTAIRKDKAEFEGGGPSPEPDSGSDSSWRPPRRIYDRSSSDSDSSFSVGDESEREYDLSSDGNDEDIPHGYRRKFRQHFSQGDRFRERLADEVYRNSSITRNLGKRGTKKMGRRGDA